MTTMIAMFTFDFSLYRKSLHVMLTATWVNEESVVFVTEHIYSAGKVSSLVITEQTHHDGKNGTLNANVTNEHTIKLFLSVFLLMEPS